MLVQSKYDNTKTKFLVQGFREGFSLGYQGSDTVKLTAPNLKLTIGTEVDLWNKIMKEVGAGRYAGPFKEIPYQHYIQSPIGLVPKDNGTQTRLIFHLSYPRGRNLSVNDNTPEHLCTVQYPDFSEAVQICLAEGKNCKIAKSDVKMAFRNVGLNPKYFKYLVMKAKSPLDGQVYYFVDKCLPFGASISCKLFQSISDAIAHLVFYKTSKNLVNYLDDYFFAALLAAMCDSQVQTFLEICSQIGFPVNLEKTYWATRILTFLGMMLDTYKQLVCVPVEKIVKATEAIQTILEKKSNKTTLLQLQKLCGLLNFLCRAIVPGRAFTRRLYAHTSGALKPYHHIKITKEMKADLRMWLQFLHHPSVFARPFTDFSKTATVIDVGMYTDATKNPKLGFGGICGKSAYMIAQWDEQFVIEQDPSIEYLELFAMTAAILAWLEKFQDCKLMVHCDNLSVVAMLNQTSSTCRNCMVLIRLIVLECMIRNVKLVTRHVPGRTNVLSDLLSRQELKKFHLASNNQFRNIIPTKILETIWPMQKIWFFGEQ